MRHGTRFLIVVALPQAAAAPQPDVQSCSRCHRTIVESYRRTAHFTSSMPPTARSIKGSFAEGRNRLQTGVPGVSFRMQVRNGAHVQTGADQRRVMTRTERFNLVIGSGRRGQSYAYWKDGILFQLPVSYLTSADRWINSPGYLDGTVDFSRLVQPRCLECHATRFDLEGPPQAPRYSDDYQLGIGCQKCHGDGGRHVAYHLANPADRQPRDILNPAKFSRQRTLDNCALCHSGARQPRRPAFTYRPGEVLDDYFGPSGGANQGPPDVHGNQVGSLERSKCFRASPAMTCSTCHDVHRTERSPAALSQKCLTCHLPARHKPVQGAGARLATACVDCHMPTEKSSALQFNSAAGRSAMAFRNHSIGIYPAATVRGRGAAGRTGQ